MTKTAPTKYGYTGQYSYVSDFGLMFYNARWYDPALGRFTQADTIVPEMGNPAAFDRYAYVYNRPVSYTDPSGHAGGIAPNGSIYYGTDIGYASIRVWNPKYNGGSMGGLVAPGTDQAQFAIHENSCGPTCVAALVGLSANSLWTIANNMVGEQLTVVDHRGNSVSQSFSDPSDGMDAHEIQYLLEEMGWETQLYVFSAYTPSWQYPTAIKNIKEKISSLLQGGYLLMALVTCNSSNGDIVDFGEANSTAHWVVITGISSDFEWIRIYNPFTNETQDLTWDQFWDSWLVQNGDFRSRFLIATRPVGGARRFKNPSPIFRDQSPLIQKCKNCPFMI